MDRLQLIILISVTIQNITTQSQEDKLDSRIDNDKNSSLLSDNEASNVVNDEKKIQDNRQDITKKDGNNIQINYDTNIIEASTIYSIADLQTASTGPRNNINDYEIDNKDETNSIKQRTIVDRVIPLKALLQLLNTRNRVSSGIFKAIEGNKRILEGVKDSSGAIIGFAKDGTNNIFDMITIPWS